METSPKQIDREDSHLQTSPNSNNNGVQIQPPLTPKPITRSETNTQPTTFIEADTSSFKQVVQMLTGSSQTFKQPSSKPPTTTTVDLSSKSVIPPIKTGPRKQGFKLYERRNSLKNLKISPLMPELVQNLGFSARNQEILSPSVLNFPSLVLSPVTPLILDQVKRAPTLCSSSNASMEEERVIAEKGFYLHQSEISTPKDSEPQLLPLFPVTSPRVSGSSS